MSTQMLNTTQKITLVETEYTGWPKMVCYYYQIIQK